MRFGCCCLYTVAVAATTASARSAAVVVVDDDTDGATAAAARVVYQFNGRSQEKYRFVSAMNLFSFVFSLSVVMNTKFCYFCLDDPLMARFKVGFMHFEAEVE